MEPSGKPTGWRKSFAAAAIFNSGASLAIHLADVTGDLLGRAPLLPSNFLFEDVLNWLQTALSIAVLVGFIGLMRGGRGRWEASWALAAWIVAATYRVVTMSRFYDREVVRLAAALYLIIPIATLLLLLLGFRRRTDPFWKKEGVPLGVLALALTVVLGVAAWDGPFEHESDIEGLAFSSDGTKLAAADWGGVTVWEFPSGKRLHRIKRFGDQAAFSPDGAVLAVTDGSDNQVNLHSAKNWELVRTIKLKCPSHVSDLIYSRDGRYLALAGKGVAILDSLTGQVLMLREMDVTHTRGVSVAFSPDGSRLAVGHYEAKTVVLLKSSDGSEVWKSSFPEDVRSVAFSPNGDTLAVALCSGDSGLDLTAQMTRLVRSRLQRSAIFLVDPGTGRTKEDVPSFTGSVHDLAFSEDGRFLGWAGNLGWIFVYEVATQRYVLSDCFPEKTHRTHYAGSGDVIAFSPNARYVACGGDLGRIGIWDLTTGRELK